MFSSTSTALMPYTPPQSPMEFIKSEVEKRLRKGTIKPEHLKPHQGVLLFNPLQFLGYGIYGQQAAIEMANVLKTHSFSITYSNKTKTFTVLGSSEASRGKIEQILERNNYLGYRPKVLEEVDPFGNRLVRLVPIFATPFVRVPPIELRESGRMASSSMDAPIKIWALPRSSGDDKPR